MAASDYAISDGLVSNSDTHTHSTEELCPHAIVNCTGGRVSYDIGTQPSYVAIVSSLISCLGSLLIILVYCLFKDLRSCAQKIITYLAVADLISALGYIGGSINFLVHFNHSNENGCKIFNYLCEAQASVTSWSSLVSFSWTLTLAFYFYLVMIYSKRNFARRLMPLYHIMAWIVPLFIIVPLASLRKLGYTPYAASNWCFVKHSPLKRSRQLEEVLLVLLAGKFWEILSYIITIYVYVHIATKLIQRRRRYQPLQNTSLIERVERRLLYIPAFFVALRIWGTIQFFYALAVYKSNDDGCILNQHHNVFMFLGYLQAIGDPGQGWGNAIVYVLLSPVVRRKLVSPVCWTCFKSLGSWIISVAYNTRDEEQHPPTRDQEGRHSHNSLATDQVLRTTRPTRPTIKVSSCADFEPIPATATDPLHQNKMHYDTFLN